MIKNHFLFGVLFLCTLNLQAQFTDDMESYIDGEPITESHWTYGDCEGVEGCYLMSSSVIAHGGFLSGFVPGDGTTKAVLDLGNKIFGGWGLEFWAYIPEEKEGSFIIHQEVPVNNDTPFSKIYFNKNLSSPGMGVIENTNLGDVSFSFPHNEWFRVVMKWDISSGISLASWFVYIYNENVIDYGTPYLDELENPATSLGGIEFLSSSLDSELYVDDFIFQDDFIVCSNEDFTNNDFKIYPNPSIEEIQIQCNVTIKNIAIYNVFGKSMLKTNNPNNINISQLAKGIYFVVIETDNGRGTQKLIKN